MAAAAIALLAMVWGAVVPFLMAGAIAYLLYPPVRYLESRSVPRPVAILILYAGTAVLLWAVARLALPKLIGEVHDLLQHLPRQTERLEHMTRRTLEDVRRVELPAAKDVLEALLRRVEAILEAFTSRLAAAVVGFAGGMVNVLLAPVLAYFILRDWEHIRDTTVGLLPSPLQRHCLALGTRVNRVLHGFIRGQLLVSALVGATAAAGLAFLNVPHGLLLGAFAGLADIIPYFGPVIGTAPAVAVALLDSPRKALYTLLLFAGIQQVESSILSPRIVGQSVGLHPLWVIGAVLVGAQLAGAVGMIAAVPVAAALNVIVGYVREQVREAMADGDAQGDPP